MTTYIVIAITIVIVSSIIYWNFEELKLLKTVTSPTRGTHSERRLIITLLKNKIHAENIFHDLYLHTNTDWYSQIDLVVIGKAGLFVFEVKDYSGWIFGDGTQKYWTQILAYGREKYKFYNPIMQNEKHISNLKAHLSICDQLPMFSIIIFYGDCQFKGISSVPHNVSLIRPNQISSIINAINEEKITTENFNVIKISKYLREAVINGEENKIRELHIQNIKKFL